MGYLYIPTPTDTPLYRMRTTLDGVTYVLRFDYTATEDRWYLSIYDAEETPLRRGIKMVPGVDLLHDARHVAGVPQGGLMLFSPQGDTPGLSEMGRSSFLLYLPAVEFDSLPD